MNYAKVQPDSLAVVDINHRKKMTNNTRKQKKIDQVTCASTHGHPNSTEEEQQFTKWNLDQLLSLVHT